MKSDKDHLKQILNTAVTATFSGMVFTTIEPADPQPEYFQTNGGKGLTAARIKLLSPRAGILQIFLGNSLLTDITRNLLGAAETESISTEAAQDSLAELLNTISGIVAENLTPPDQTFTLGLPEIVAQPQIPGEDEKTVVDYFSLEGGQLLVLAASVEPV